MKLVRFSDPRQFQDRVSPFLVQLEAENNLPLGIIANLVGGEFREQSPYLAAVEDGGEIQFVVLRTPPFPALFSHSDPVPGQEITQLVLDDLRDVFGANLSGVTANKPLAAVLRQSWVQRTGLNSELDMAMRIYKLEEVRTPEGVPGRLQKAGPGDRELLEEWYAGFHREALGEEQSPEKVRKQVEKFLTSDPGQRGLRVWKVKDQLVSMAGYSGPTPHGIRVGAVFTPHQHRKNGFASACVASLSQELLDEGFSFCFLFTDLQNPTSNQIYQEIGYQPVGDVDTYRFFPLDREVDK